jgi:hypothetical protein
MKLITMLHGAEGRLVVVFDSSEGETFRDVHLPRFSAPADVAAALRNLADKVAGL